jgi:NAD(P)-dependent dehydrogenase (short-subunit alcohol dehydrogenase family)
MSGARTHEGRIGVVTGAASGIGQATAVALRDAGYIVGALDQTAEGLPEGTAPLLADVRDAKAVSTAIDAFATQHGRIDLLVNNAGVSFVGGIEAGSEDDWHRVLDINVMGQMRVLRAALPWLLRSNAASVIAMSSCTATNGIAERALYSASKGAVHAMMLSVATDLVGEGICVNAIAPGTVDTAFMTELANRAPDPAAKRREFEARQPTGRMVAPAEIANAVLFLADPVNRSITGTTLVLDGGMGTIRNTAKRAP